MSKESSAKPQGAKRYCYEYPRPALTVDIVVLTRESRPRVLLIRRQRDPFAGRWALPGGFAEMEETLEESARRELWEETGVRVSKLEQLQTFGDPGRDPRGRTVSVVYLARVAAAVEACGSDDAAEARWHSLARPPALAFDHDRILALVRSRLRGNASAKRR